MAIEDGKIYRMSQEELARMIKGRCESFARMMAGLPEKGYQIAEIREEAGFISHLAVKQIHKNRKGMLIICAGGGFLLKSWNEALPVAEFFYKKGINVSILDYHVGHDRTDKGTFNAFRMAGEDGLAAIRYLRVNADQLGIDPDHIAIGGFSAGGMLSGYAATQFDYGDLNSSDPYRRVSSRPDAALILYGAFSFTNTVPVSMGRMTQQELIDANRVDNVRNIKVDSPPMFVFQTHEDDPRIALNFCYELAVHGVSYEIHTFENGAHGGGLYNGEDETPDEPHTAMWSELAADWLLRRGF